MVTEPVPEYDAFSGHYHLNTFDRQNGQEEFLQKIESVFARNGLAYKLEETGQIVRLAPPVIRELLQASTFQTGDSHLDSLLELARGKFLDPDPSVRSESLEKLWDAWERLKTVVCPSDKKKSIRILLDKAAPDANFRERLEKEARELTDIGNSFTIRHHELGKIPIHLNEQVDYLFQRLFALIYLLLKSL